MALGKHTVFLGDARRTSGSRKLSEIGLPETVKTDGVRLYFDNKMVSGAFGAICALPITRDVVDWSETKPTSFWTE